MRKRILATLLAITLLCGLALLPATALAADSDFVINEIGGLTEYTGPGGDVVIPDGVTIIGFFAFKGCTSLTSVTIPEGVTEIGGSAFDGCTGLTSVTIPESVTFINGGAFSDCTSLTNVTIPDGVTVIGGEAFRGCTGLTSVSIPDSVIDILEGAFSGCTSLTSVTIPNSMFHIDRWAFKDCTSLTSVTIPDGAVSTWGSGYSRIGLNIPGSETWIDDGVFEGCTGLTDVYYGGTEEQWNAMDPVNERWNAPLKSATIHYNGTMPEQPSAPATNTAYPSTQTVDVDGKAVEFQMYALKDANGNPTNYVKVRDLALALNGTKAHFSVDWNGAVNLVAGAAYTPNGSENATPFSGERAYTVPSSPTNVNGSASDLTAIFLTDDNGGGYTYYQLRDLGAALGFRVDWTAEKGIFIETK